MKSPCGCELLHDCPEHGAAPEMDQFFLNERDRLFIAKQIVLKGLRSVIPIPKGTFMDILHLDADVPDNPADDGREFKITLTCYFHDIPQEEPDNEQD